MKKHLLTILSVIFCTMAFGQLTFVKEVSGYRHLSFPISLGSIDIHSYNFLERSNYILAEPSNNNGEKQIDYLILDLDYNVYKNLTLDTTNALGGSIEVYEPWISDHLFNSDDNIEYCYYIASIGPTSSYTVVRTVIADEDNNVLFSLEGERFDFNDFYVLNGTTYVRTITNDERIKIYEVEGSMPCIRCNSATSSNAVVETEEQNYGFSIFPNPTEDQLTIDSDLEGPNMQIKIYSITGQLLQTDAFFTGNNTIDVSLLSAGTYVINIVSENGFLHTQQFIRN